MSENGIYTAQRLVFKVLTEGRDYLAIFRLAGIFFLRVKFLKGKYAVSSQLCRRFSTIRFENAGGVRLIELGLPY